jgi:hypothetical protein
MTKTLQCTSRAAELPLKLYLNVAVHMRLTASRIGGKKTTPVSPRGVS